MARRLLMVFIFAYSVSGVIGQDTDGDQPRRGNRGDRGDRGPRMGRMFDRIAEDLQLDESQQQQYDALVEAQREKMEAFGELRRAMREARENGDDAKVEELRAQMSEGNGPREFMQQFFESLNPILTEEQRAQLAERQERFRERRGRGRGGEGGERPGRGGRGRMFRDLPEQLNLDDGQKAQFDEYVNSQREKMRKGFEEQRALRREMREAREAGDDARVEELRGQIDAMPRPDWGAGQKDMLTYVETILREDQKPLLSAFRDQMEIEGDDSENLPRDLRSVLRAAVRVRLDRAQREELKTISREARASLKEARRADRRNRGGDREAEQALAAKVKADIVKVLNEEQVAKFEEELKRTERSDRGNRERRRNRPTRPEVEL